MLNANEGAATGEQGTSNGPHVILNRPLLALYLPWRSPRPSVVGRARPPWRTYCLNQGSHRLNKIIYLSMTISYFSMIISLLHFASLRSCQKSRFEYTSSQWEPPAQSLSVVCNNMTLSSRFSGLFVWVSQWRPARGMDSIRWVWQKKKLGSETIIRVSFKIVHAPDLKKTHVRSGDIWVTGNFLMKHLNLLIPLQWIWTTVNKWFSRARPLHGMGRNKWVVRQTIFDFSLTLCY